MVRKSRIIAGLYASVLMASAASADATGLGRLTILSALGEPLRAEIDLLDVPNADISQISVKMAGADAFQQAHVDRAPVVSNIRLVVEKKKSGKAVVKVLSSQVVNDPFVDFLVELQWPTGKLVREYTVLLDPPGYTGKQEAVAPVTLPSVADTVVEKPIAPPPAKTEPESAGKTAVATKPPKKEPPKKEKPAVAATEQADKEKYGPVKKGQTLTQIAEEVKPEDVSLEEMLVALYRANPNAFAGGNMNRLVTGKILTVPSAEDVAKVGKTEAHKEIRAQVADWNAYRQKMAASVEATPAPAAKEAGAKQAASGKITAKTEEKAAPKSSQDVLRLSKGGEGAKGEAKMRAIQEDLVAKDKALKDANERIAALEKQNADMQRLLEIRSKNGAAVQQAAKPAAPQVVPAKPVAPPTTGAGTPPVPPSVTPSAAAKPEQKEPAKAEAKPAGAEQKAPEVSKPEVKPAEKPKKPKQPPKVVQPQKESSLVDSILQNPLTLGGVLAGLLLVVGLVLLMVKRVRDKRIEKFESSLMSSGDLGAAPGKPEEGKPTSNTSFLTDFSQAGLGTIDTNEVDPIAEAEVYMAYGRDNQAEEILKEALSKDPARREIHLKLLEIYAGRKDVKAFETLATELYASVAGSNDPVWAKAAELGRGIDPANPLYTGATQAAEAKGDLERTLVLSPQKAAALQEEAAAPSVPAAPAPSAEALTDLDFDLEVAPAAAPAQEESFDIDLDLAHEAPVSAAGEDVHAAETLVGDELAKAEPAVADESLDFILNEPAAAPSAPVPAHESAAPEALDFDLADFGAVEMPAAEEVKPVQASTEEPAELDDLLDISSSVEPSAPAVATFAAEAPVEAPESMEEISLDMPVAAVEEPVASPSAMPSAAADLDFDFNVDEPVASAPVAEPIKPTAPAFDMSSISLEMEEPAASPVEAPVGSGYDEGRWQEAATKLDLAKAYVEMGDREGAREILQEVLDEGSGEQQAEAQSMLNELG